MTIEMDYYEFLGVSRDASIDEIQKAFREKALILHPDKNKDNPQAAQEFKVLSKAWHTLSDPERRKFYTETLPAQKKPVDPLKNLLDLWQNMGKLYLEQAERYSPAIEALRVSAPLALEDDNMLIVGIDPSQSMLLGYVNVQKVHSHVQRILSDLAGKPMDFQLIVGTTLHDWEMTKATEAHMKRRKTSGGIKAGNGFKNTDAEEADQPTTGGIDVERHWEELMEGLTRSWSAVETRTFPQSRAHYVMDQLPLLSRAEDISRVAGAPDEQTQRSIAKAIERISSSTGIESGVIGLEYVRYRSRQLRGSR